MSKHLVPAKIPEHVWSLIIANAFDRYPEPTDAETGEPVDDWGFAESDRAAFIEGARFAYRAWVMP